jgi:glycerol-3-phosphate acyltransferase PlsY
MGKYLLTAVIGYLIGNFASSYFLGKITKNIDIREHGSGNAGATNTFRVLGVKAGVIVFILDVLKGVLATLIGLWLTGNQLGAVLSGGMAVIGHNWPALLNFRGGKGIASSFGLILTMFPTIGLILFVIAAALIAATKYVSLGSIIAAILFPVLLVVFSQPPAIILVGTVLALIALYRHRENIKRLLKGKENKFSFSSKKKREDFR